MKKFLLSTLLVLTLGATTTASAATITLPPITLPIFSSIPPTAKNSVVPIGTFNYTIPTGYHVTSAVIRGGWGNSSNPTSAHNELSIDGFAFKNSLAYNPDSYYVYDVPWIYTFESANLAMFDDGIANFTAEMLSPASVPKTIYVDADGDGTPEPYTELEDLYIRLSPTSLTLQVEATPAPEPSSMVLGLMGLGSMLGLRRKKA